jgi:acyl carrier protein
MLTRGLLDTGGRVKAILAKALLVDPELVRSNALLVDDLNVGSLDRFELIMDLEAEFGLEIREEDLVGAKTVGDVIRCLDAQIKGAVVAEAAP